MRLPPFLFFFLFILAPRPDQISPCKCGFVSFFVPNFNTLFLFRFLLLSASNALGSLVVSRFFAFSLVIIRHEGLFPIPTRWYIVRA